MNRAIFVELDGIIRFNVLNKISMIKSIGEIGIYTDRVNTLRELKELGFKILGIAYQPNLDQDFSAEVALATNEKTAFLFDEIVWCNHSFNETCFCKKPDPSLIESLISKYELDLNESVFIGMGNKDLVYALNARIKNFFFRDNFFVRNEL